VILILLSAGTICAHANTSAALSSVLESTNSYEEAFGVQYSAPYSEAQRSVETIDTQGGSLTVSQVDLTLPGKNGMDLSFSRSFNNQQLDTVWGLASTTTIDVSVDMYRRAMVYLGSRAEAEDVIQEAFIRLLGRAPAFTSGEHEKLHSAP